MSMKPGVPPPPSQVQAKTSPKATVPQASQLNMSSGAEKHAERIVIFGSGKIGKSTIASHLPGPLFLDIDRGTKFLNVMRDATIRNWIELRARIAAIEQAPPKGMQSLIIDTATVAEEFAKEHVVQTRLTEKGKTVSSIEDFGWGKGWQFVFDEFCALMADLDRIADKHGVNVVLIAHEVSSPVPNPAGEDFIRWEPHLYSGDKKGRGSIRDRVKQWADHIVFIAYDMSVTEGKARGVGSRSYYTFELPTHIAGSRSAALCDGFDLADPAKLWRDLGVIPS